MTPQDVVLVAATVWIFWMSLPQVYLGGVLQQPGVDYRWSLKGIIWKKHVDFPVFCIKIGPIYLWKDGTRGWIQEKQ